MGGRGGCIEAGRVPHSTARAQCHVGQFWGGVRGCSLESAGDGGVHKGWLGPVQHNNTAQAGRPFCGWGRPSRILSLFLRTWSCT